MKMNKERLNNKFKMKGTCVLKEDIIKGEFHYSPWTESKKDSIFEYVRKYSKCQKANNECSKKDVLDSVIWRCNEDITDLYGNVMFTKGLIYEQVKTDQYPMMLIDNNVEESEVYNLKDSFTSI